MHAEDAVNVRLVPDADLDVGLAAKSGVGVNVLPLGKDASNGVEGLLSRPLPRKMKKVDNRTVEFAKAEIGAANILRYLSTGGGDDRLEASIRCFDGMDTVGTDKVQAESGVDYCADHEWLYLPAFLLEDSLCPFVSPFESPIRVCFPEVDPGAEPIVVIFARLKSLIREQTFARFAVTAVIAKNEGCGKVMHPAGTAW